MYSLLRRRLLTALLLAAAPAAAFAQQAPPSAPAPNVRLSHQGARSDVEIEFPSAVADDAMMQAPSPASQFLDLKPARPDATLAWRTRSSAALNINGLIPLGQSMTVSLKKDLKDAAGKQLIAPEPILVPGEPFRLTSRTPSWFQQGSATARNPRLTLYFNDLVDPVALTNLLFFTSKEGARVPAFATTPRLATLDRYRVPVGSWKEQQAAGPESSNSRHKPLPPDSPDLAGSVVIVHPQGPLPIGSKWQLVLPTGLPNLDRNAFIQEPASIEIGDIPELKLIDHTAEPVLDGQRRIILSFNKSVASESLPDSRFSKYIVIQPTPPKLTWKASGSQLIASADFLLSTTYNVSLFAGLPAADGTTLPSAFQGNLTFSAHPPHLSLPAYDAAQWLDGRGTFEFATANLHSAAVSVKRIAPEMAPLALRGYSAYQQDRADSGENTRIPPLTVPGKVVFNTSFPSAVAIDQSERFRFSWDQVSNGKRQPGLYFIDASGPAKPDGLNPRNQPSPLGAQSIVQLTDIGVAWKRGPLETTLFAFSHSTARPIAAASLTFYNEDCEPTHRATTDANGLVTFSDPAARWLVLQSGNDYLCLPAGAAAPALNMWSFNIPWESASSSEPTRDLLFFTERPVYQPGETVYLKSISRLRSPAGLTLPPPAEPARLRFFDPRGRLISENTIAFSDSGTYSTSWSLPVGTIGWFRAEIDFPPPANATPPADNEDEDHFTRRNRSSFSTPIFVQEYQPNSFKLSFDGTTASRDAEALHVPISAAYFMGKALSKASLSWTARLAQASFNPAKWPDFSFGIQPRTWVSDGDRYFELEQSAWSAPLLTGQGSLTLSDKGTATIDAPIPSSFGVPGPKSLSIEAEVTDINQQTIAGSFQHTEHSSAFYLGAKRPNRASEVGEEITMEIAAVQSNGDPVTQPVDVTLTLERLTWNAVRVEAAGGGTSVRNDPVFATVSEHHLSVAPSTTGGTPFSFRPAAPGSHNIVLTAKDAAGAAVKSVISFDVYKQGSLWQSKDGIQIELTPDRDSYAEGDSARILVKSPLNGTALVTVERHKVLHQQVVQLAPGGIVEIPIQKGWAPNVFVSVTHLRGGLDDPREIKSPEYRTGFANLNISGGTHHLAIALKPSQPEFRPGTPVSITATATDSAGQPLPNTELALWAVDEGILSLMPWQAPDPSAFFHRPASLSVTTGLSLTRLLDEDPKSLDFANKGFTIGGGGDDSAPAIPLRKDFKPVAFWHGNLRTAADGSITVSFPAPDNLTEFRVLAVANEGAARFGSASSSFRINKPLMLEPALPRFANSGDEVVLQAILHNTTPNDTSVDLELVTDDHVLILNRLGGSPQPSTIHVPVSIPAGATRAASIPVRFVKAGHATFRWKASGPSPDLSDAIENALDVGHSEPLLRDLTFASLSSTDAARNLLASVRPEVLAGEGSVTVTISNSRLLEASEAISQLLHYPYGCAEQTMSSLLPWLTLRDLRAVLPNLKQSNDEIAAAIQAGANRLLSMQTDSGGLAYWPGATDTNPWASAHGAVGLIMARNLGASVPEPRLTSLLDFLSKSLRDNTDASDSWNLECQTHALWALSIAGRPEPSYHETFFNRRDSLGNAARALLALAIAESNTNPDMVRTLLAVPPSKEESHWLGSERIVAIRAMAYLKITSPDANSELGRLMASRSPNGDWRNTYNNGWVLLALSRESASLAAWDSPRSCTVTCGSEIRELTLPASPASQSISFSRAANSPAPSITITVPQATNVFSSIEITGRAAPGPQPERHAGLGIRRSYQKLAGDGSLSPADNLRSGDLILVSLDVDVPTPTQYLVIDDPLPATMEGVNPDFSTMAGSSALANVNTLHWSFDHAEIRRDRVLFFRNYCATAGNFQCQYLARVVAAGNVIAPQSRIEAMYNPAQFGLSAASRLQSSPDDSIATTK